MDLLEKRLRSRFSHRQFVLSHPSREDYEKICRRALAGIPGAEALEDHRVVSAVRRWHSIGRPVRCLLQWLGLALSRSDGIVSADVLLGASKELWRSPLEDLLEDLSPLELSLLGAMAHIDLRGGMDGEGAAYNFTMVFDEYMKYAHAQGAATMAVSREVALKGFETLHSLGFTQWTQVGKDASDATLATVHMSRPSQLVRLQLAPELLVEFAKSVKGEGLPTALRHWMVHGVQT
jgi:hypothetical protein